MSSIASVMNGQLAAQADTTASTSSSNSAMDKDAFLQLLVAQMKYQDPLEPTSNTEYVAQYATFSQVEQLQNMSSTLDSSSAMQLVGKYVTMDVETANGGTTTISGRVDYVEKSGTKTLLYIDGTPYNYENLNTVWDDEYLEAFQLCDTWGQAVTALPSAGAITLDYEESVKKLRETYDAMSDYQKGFVGTALTAKLKEVEEAIGTLKKAAQAAQTGSETTKTGSETAQTT